MTYLDRGGYPTESAYKRIREWNHQDIPGLFAFVRSLWWAADWGVREHLSAAESSLCHGRDKKEPILRFATGGWSGNEGLIRALQENHIIWAVTWLLSARGGLHIFRAPKEGQNAETGTN